MSTIVQWAPFTATELGAMERRMRRLMERTTSGFAAAPGPAAKIYDAGDESVAERETRGPETRSRTGNSTLTP